MKRRKNFRVGQRVQLASDPTRTFVIAKSRVPDRIYFEQEPGTPKTNSSLLARRKILPRVTA